ncbi:leucyl-tRNA synthetase, class Ia, archaeal/eukaryotic cytosolic [Diplogelasinospora grovesii]|uniref:leucine--tRNA ligase n=1 Tax=Diplogelasinospora grovesii TaxID=303347 RepID=A0AAN6NFU0_9PEZI|nr:leucyl-tRNA synthetase, class Ia, archaeal/eukaryotic cytosolic [Diplogelasinospora grovesii]
MDGDTCGQIKIENTQKRDTLCATEKKYQKLWQDEKVFESDAPSCSEYPVGLVTPDDLAQKFPKFFATMAYPYVNGAPHLGHAFTVSKVEFASRVARAQGKNTLCPQGYHATGMPIKACADKLVNEIAMFGETFEGCNEVDITDEASSAESTQLRPREDVTKFTNVKKGKAALKTTKAKYQFQVMLSLGIPRHEIHKFSDAKYWLYYFPQLWRQHLTEFGCAIDWRRSFITTDVNGYYDSFVRWQMRRLKDLGKIRFGKRYTIYSPKDGQPCLDHDRASGEGVLAQEYTALKCKVRRWSEQAQQLLALDGKIPSNANIFMVAATLRPETMCGQTNLFISPSIMYGIFQVSDTDFYLCTDRAARNMAFQGIFPEWGVIPKIMEISGSDVVGSVVHAPLSFKGDVYVLPMNTIKETKGTGVVASVPSDSPDDFAMTVELSKKADFYNIKQEWVCTEVISIIDTPEYGGTIAPALIKKLKISSPKDERQLLEAKEIAYKIGFYQGNMVLGEFAGKQVQEAKPLVRQRLLDSGDAFAYCEPDGLVVSRSGDECIAAFLDQWFLNYGTDEAWRDATLQHLRGEDGLGFNCFTAATKHSLKQTFGWMVEWSVTRQYGLGTALPWDPSQMVEGLSDSAIYMAYYTVAHFLHSDIYGKEPGIANLSVSQMTDDVWNYVFALADEVKSDIDKPVLDAMRREFTYWYPLDIRISGKDLINNHLVFFLYIHQAIWGEQAARYLPKGIRINGHLTLNGDKMSKSTGNFLTLHSAIQKFGADATRIALADGGDGVDDANFEETAANAAILKLFELRKWIERVMTDARLLKPDEEFSKVRETEGVENANLDSLQRTGAMVFWDELFNNDLNRLVRQTVQAYEATNYKAALKSGFYDFTSARDSYRSATLWAGIGMHHDCARRYVELQALMIYIIAPHWADYIWREVLKKPSTIQVVTFPEAPQPDPTLDGISEYIRTVSARIRAADAGQQKRLAKGKGVIFDPSKAKCLNIYVAKTWPAWQAKYVDVARKIFDGISLDLKQAVKEIDKADMKKAMPFVQDLKRRLEAGEEGVFDSRTLGFDEVKVLEEMVPLLTATVPKLEVIKVFHRLPERAAASAEPGAPFVEFVNL